jgi:hypothetical protein
MRGGNKLIHHHVGVGLVVGYPQFTGHYYPEDQHIFTAVRTSSLFTD